MEQTFVEATISHMNAGPNRVLNKECRKKQSVVANKLWYMSHVTCDL
jgi:hypothetical protein